MVRGKLEILLVTSRDTGRWIIPKGWPMSGLPPEAAALREAWEEAGVQGRPRATCIGVYNYSKAMGPGRTIPCLVAVYPVKVAQLRDGFPERKERRRKWFAPEKAASKVDEPELQALILGFTPTKAGRGNAASPAATDPPPEPPEQEASGTAPADTPAPLQPGG